MPTVSKRRGLCLPIKAKHFGKEQFTASIKSARPGLQTTEANVRWRTTRGDQTNLAERRRSNITRLRSLYVQSGSAKNGQDCSRQSDAEIPESRCQTSGIQEVESYVTVCRRKKKRF